MEVFYKGCNRLVRDKIPEIIEASGKSCEVEVVSDEIALKYLYIKLEEETKELLEDNLVLKNVY